MHTAPQANPLPRVRMETLPDAVELLAERGWPLPAVLQATPSVPFSENELALLVRQLKQAAVPGGGAYDLALASDAAKLPLGQVTLRSVNFGFDFTLIKTASVRRLPGFTEGNVAVYVALCGQDRHGLLLEGTSLGDALKALARAYQEAAAAHLP